MLTKITKGLFQGKHLNDIERDMTDHRQLNARKKNRANNTKPPRTRDGQTYPGGKAMRRALANLARRQNEFNSMKDASSYTKPGAR